MGEYRWIDAGNGRQVYRRVHDAPPPPRSDLPTPMLIRDFPEPVQSCANGRWYSSKRDLAASHRASGNPHGVDFIEIGNDKQEFVEYTPDPKKRREDILEAKRDLDAGWRPDVLTLED